MPTRTACPTTANEYRKPLALAIWSALIFIAIVLMSRRVAGAFTAELPAWAACSIATFAAALSLVAYLLLRWTGDLGTRVISQLGAAVVTLAPPLTMGLVLLPVQSAAGFAYLLTLFLVAAAALVLLDEPLTQTSTTPGAIAEPLSPWERGRGEGIPTDPETPRTAEPLSLGERGRGEGILPEDAPLRCPVPPSENGVAQTPRSALNGPGSIANRQSPIANPQPAPNQTWISRTISPTGQESLEGVVQIRFAPGQKQAVAHVPFCPPFAGLPEVTCAPLDDSGLRCKLTAYTYGARIEAKRLAADTEECIPVGFSAIAGVFVRYIDPTTGPVPVEG